MVLASGNLLVLVTFLLHELQVRLSTDVLTCIVMLSLLVELLQLQFIVCHSTVKFALKALDVKFPNVDPLVRVTFSPSVVVLA